MIDRSVEDYRRLGWAFDTAYLTIQKQHDEGGLLTRWTLGNVLTIWRGVYKGAKLNLPRES